MTEDGPCVTLRGAVDAWECDQMGHMNVRFYARRFSQAEALIFTGLRGLRPLRDAMTFRREIRVGAPLSVESWIMSGDDREVVTLRHDLRDDGRGGIAATMTADHAGAGAAAADALADLRRRLPAAPAPRATGAPRRPLREQDAVLSGRRALEPGEVADGAIRREVLVGLVNHAMGHLGVDRFRLRDPETGRLTVGSSVVSLEIDRRGGAAAGDVVSLGSRFVEIGSRAAVARHDLTADGAGLVASVKTVTVFFDAATRRALPLPAGLVDMLQP